MSKMISESLGVLSPFEYEITQLYAFSYKQHFYTPGWNWQKIKQMLSNTLRLNFWYLETIHIHHPGHHPNIIGHTLKNKQKNKCVCIHETVRLIIIIMKMKMKNRSHR